MLMLIRYQYVCIECERMFKGSFPFRRSVIWVVMLCNLMSQLMLWSNILHPCLVPERKLLAAFFMVVHAWLLLFSSEDETVCSSEMSIHFPWTS
jgi:hypothetical protein